LDWLLLQLPSSRSFRGRYVHARDAIVEFVRARPPAQRVAILSVPCGIARELVDAATLLRGDGEDEARTRWVGVDLDKEALEATARLVAERGVGPFHLTRADVFDPRGLPPGMSVVTSTGLGEFLTDEQLLDFYRRCHAALEPGGWFVTSA